MPLNIEINRLWQLYDESQTAHVRKEKQFCHLNTENSAPYGQRESRYFSLTFRSHF